MPSCLKLVSAGIAGLAATAGLMKYESANPVVMGAQRKILLAVDGLLDQLQDPTPAWAEQFAGGFLPAQPSHGIPTKVAAGSIPADLDGVYLRVGPNTAHYPPKKRTHVFDGDGFVHSVRLENGKATYHGSYVNTPRFNFEKDYGKEYFGRLGEIYGLPGLPKAMLQGPKLRYSGLTPLTASTANTAVGLTPCGHTWALNEGGLPFRIRVAEDGSVSSLGYDTLDGTLQLHVSAHPKYDYHTGETFFHGKDLMDGTFHVGRIRDGKLIERVLLPIGAGFQHDMFITKDYVVVLDGSMRFDPKNAIKKNPLWNFDTTHNLAFFIWDRSTPFALENFHNLTADLPGEIVHTLYGFNKGATITLYTPVGFSEPTSNDGILGGMGVAYMHKFTLDMASKTVKIEQVEGGMEFNTEFGRVRDDLIAAPKPARFGFSALQRGNGFNFTGIQKWDMQENKQIGVIHHAPGIVGGEPVFVANGKRFSDELGDDGYVSMFLWNTETQESHFALFDAKTFSPTPALLLALPKKVPLGFHGWWLSKEEIASQL